MGRQKRKRGTVRLENMPSRAAPMPSKALPVSSAARISVNLDRANRPPSRTKSPGKDNSAGKEPKGSSSSAAKVAVTPATGAIRKKIDVLYEYTGLLRRSFRMS